MANASRLPSKRPVPNAGTTMTTTPTSAMPLASRVVRRSRAPVHARTMAAVMKGAVAFITSTSATEVSRRALMKQIVAAVEQPAARRPGRRMRRIAARVPAPSRHTT